MNRKSAETAISLVKGFDRIFNELTIITTELDDKDEGKFIRGHLGRTMIEFDEILRHIIKQYPDLDPDRK